MNVKFRRCIALLLGLLFLSTLLSGCAQKSPTLRIVTENGKVQGMGMNDQIKVLVNQFQQLHPEVEIVLEELPADARSREMIFEQLRAEIMSGKGPDVLLMPTSDPIAAKRELLISDVNLAMRNGVFTDISELYDADMDLDKENLLTTVLDAGIVDDARYVLPLRYDIPILFVNTKIFENSGIDTDILSKGIVDLINAVKSQYNKPDVRVNPFIIIREFMFNFFPEIIDYDAQEIVVSQEQFSEFITAYLSTKDTNGGTTDLYQYISGMKFWANNKDGLNIGDMNTALEVAAIAKANDIKLEMYPIRATDGSVIADVTYYGAVCNGSNNPDLAYEFLAQMLSEMYQWDWFTSRPTTMETTSVDMAANGYPVRVAGSVQTIYRALKGQTTGGILFSGSINKALERRRDLVLLKLTDEDIPVLQSKIDKVRFPCQLENTFAGQIQQRKIETDPDTLAAGWIEELRWHLYEG